MPPAVSISARTVSVVTTIFSPAGWAAACGAAGAAAVPAAPGATLALGTSPWAAAPLAAGAEAACCVVLGKNIDAWPWERCQLS
ncbi:hypothetical protein D9M72_568730 [compost metagenome]